VSSLAWNARGSLLAVGSRSGRIAVWDVARRRRVRDAPGHGARVGTLCWRGDALASGSRDRAICCRDVREPRSNYARLRAHRQEVCGLRWSPCGDFLASGGNDNDLKVWDARRLLQSSAGGEARRGDEAPAAAAPRPGVAPRPRRRRAAPLCSFGDHVAAVKAIAWSPHKRGSLASGAGTADRTIKFWDARTCALVDSVDTGSQVCALAWSRSVDELVSTHGYSLNQICIWNVPSLTNYATLTGHCRRVLYLAISPDNQTIVTGAGDETLRFWSCFPGARGPGRAPPHAPTVLR
jgi:cell division cycle 20-like protein 1 (cofactor of APC complex)